MDPLQGRLSTGFEHVKRRKKRQIRHHLENSFTIEYNEGFDVPIRMCRGPEAWLFGAGLLNDRMSLTYEA
jgi:hypothetical protein